jgi:hypothetical protein
MIKDTYRYMPSKRHTRFAFQSEGDKGKIVKIIEFYSLENGKWNLGFGDWNKGTVDDKVVSNNQDTMKVIRTVANVTVEFFKQYPDSVVVIEPVDEKRKKFYNLIFQRYYKDISPYFNILGKDKNKEETYILEKFYDSFEISLKFEL